MTVSFTKWWHTRVSEENLAAPFLSILGYKIMLPTKKCAGVGGTIVNGTDGGGVDIISHEPMLGAGGWCSRVDPA